MKRLQYILFLFASVIAYGQVTLVTAVEGKDFRVGERMKVTVTLRIEGNDRIQETPLRTPDFSKFEQIGSGSDQTSYIEPVSQTVINQQVFQWVLSPKTVGKVRVGSFLVQVNGRIYKTEPIDLDVGNARIAERTNKKDDVYLNLEVQNREVFENEPTVAVIRAYSSNFNNLRNIGDVNLAHQKGIEVKPVSFEKSDIEQSPKSRLLSQVVAVYMLYPEKTGAVEVRPATASYSSGGNFITLKSNKVSLRVKTLPKGSPSNFNNTVGNYTVDIESPSAADAIELNKPLDVIVKVTGEGNLDKTKMPKLARSAAYTFYRPKIKQAENNTLLAHYVVVPKIPGDIEILTEKFAFFNPETQKYSDLESALPVKVLTPEEIENAKTTLETVNDFTNNVLETVDTPVMPTKKLRVQPNAGFRWQTLVGNYTLIGLFAFAVLSAYWAYRRFLSPAQPREIPLGSIAETEAKLREMPRFDVETHFSYLERLISAQQYDDFFKNIEDLKQDAQRFIRKKYSIGLKDYFVSRHGASVAERFQKLEQQIAIEKYAPVKTDEHLEELLGSAKSLYSLIN